MVIKKKFSIAIVDIEKCRVIEGGLPSKQLKFILAWAAMRHDELMNDWELAKMHRELQDICPLG